QRTGKGIWQNLYEFPLLESEKEETRESFVQKPELKKLVDAKKIELFNEKPIKHVLSHQKLFAKFWIVSCEKLPTHGFSSAFTVMEASEVKKYPVPVLLEKFINTFHFWN
ncbi:MAG TPA: NUDIX domain-containing protein, partial [Flavobacteriaceae bacterium]|nr:NUDIX domain-containing protein [Flavobacteriaceae bacterium]